MTIAIKRAYEKAEASDGFRILVDRLWPRGVSKEEASIDVWLKEIAPSDALRKWYHHEEKWPEFKKRYFAELKDNTDAVAELKTYLKHKKVTFVYASKDTETNNAVALKDYIESH